MNVPQTMFAALQCCTVDQPVLLWQWLHNFVVEVEAGESGTERNKGGGREQCALEGAEKVAGSAVKSYSPSWPKQPSTSFLRSAQKWARSEKTWQHHLYYWSWGDTQPYPTVAILVLLRPWVLWDLGLSCNTSTSGPFSANGENVCSWRNSSIPAAFPTTEAPTTPRWHTQTPILSNGDVLLWRRAQS